MQQPKKYLLTENIIYLSLFSIVFLFPVLFSLKNGNLNFQRLLHEYFRLFPYLIIFVFHNYFLSKLILKKEYSFYLLISSGLILSVNLIFQQIIELNLVHIPPPPGINQLPPEKLSRFFFKIIISILTIGLNIAIKLLFQWAKEKRKNEILELQNTKNELEYLKNQISPHFFMNTLNNIHALIDYDKEIAKNSVIKLSKLMRVILYDTDKNNFTLKNEIDFINDYIELMKIRVNPKVEINFNYPQQLPNLKIQPLLFINLVENAFKHGIKAIGKSFIHIKFEIENNWLTFNIKNSKADNNSKHVGKVGLENSIKRFDLIYAKNHTFDIDENEDYFEVKVNIKLIN